jgi:BirA family biotin operon repressor/biotin-[acetyl-CoA-carboxylase] ligase
MTEERVSSWHGHDAEELRERWDREEVHLFGSVTSTMDVARGLAEDEEAPDGTVVLAREQTEGRGRADRVWHSPPGGLYLSMVFRPGRVTNPAILPVLAGLGIAREFDGAWPGAGVALKWPNDLLAGGRKLGGVLSEAVSGEEGVRFLVVGVGVNVAPLPGDVPGEIREGATSLEDAVGEEVDPVEAADAVIRGLEAYVPDAPPGLDEGLLELVDEYDWLRDRRVSVRLPDEEEPLPGMCVGIAPDGKLLFRPDRGALRRLDRGDVEVVETA